MNIVVGSIIVELVQTRRAALYLKWPKQQQIYASMPLLQISWYLDLVVCCVRSLFPSLRKGIWVLEPAMCPRYQRIYRGRQGMPVTCNDSRALWSQDPNPCFKFSGMNIRYNFGRLCSTSTSIMALIVYIFSSRTVQIYNLPVCINTSTCT